MVLDYYKLRDQPFGASPDSRYLFESQTHREAVASLLYGIEARRGFLALVAKPGMGKTTLLFRTLSRLKGNAKTVFLFQTICTPLDFLRALLTDLGVQQVNGSIVELQSKLTKILLELSQRHERLVIIVDEAQNLDNRVLELIRMLSNFETSTEKLIQIILSGQPTLARRLASPNLIQLRQRVSIIARLRPFSYEETAAYIEHRLRVAGWESKRSLFDASAVRLIAEHSGGIPRNVNNLCFNSMSIACALKRRIIDDEIVREVIADLDLDPLTDGEIPSGEKCPVATSQATVSKRTMGARRAWFPKALAASALMFSISGMRTQTRVNRFHPVGVGAPRVGMRPTLAATPELQDQKTLRSLPPSVAPPEGPESKNRSLASLPPMPSGPFRRVLVQPGATLSEICAESFSTCGLREIQMIQRLNPWLTNPDHLESGRQLHIPIQVNVSSAAVQSPAAPSSDVAATEIATQ
jgi:general secretion pathway protein A